MLTDSPSLVAALLEHHLLEGPAAEAALPELAAACATPADLVAELVRRRWLTHFQAELVLAGRAPELGVEKYVLLERLGQGGMGAVYKARHRVLKAVRAVKIIHPERLTGPNAVKRFFQEVEAVGKLYHPNIILPHDAGESGGLYFLAMEYVPGADLGRLLEREGPLPAADACEYIRQGALALQHAHERGLVHRDVKPSNLLVSSADGRVKLLDLGLARVRAVEEEELSPQTALTQAGAMMGTPDYMAPEQAVDSHGVDTRADVYALGCTLYHVLAGRTPFPGSSVMEKLVKHRREEAVPLERLRSDLPAGLAAVVRKAMAKTPESRYQTPAELAAALAPFCAGARAEKPRPAGASGEHPILAPVTRLSLTPPPDAGPIDRAPTPPARPTIKAPPGYVPPAAARTVPVVAVPKAAAPAGPARIPVAPPPRRRKIGTSAVFVGLAAVAGVALAVGGRYFLRQRPAAAEVTAAAGRPPEPAPVPPPVTAAPGPAVPAPAPPEAVRPGVSRAGDGADGRARTRPEGGAFPGAEGRAAPRALRELLYRLNPEQTRRVALAAGGGRAAVVTDDQLDVYDLAAKGPRLAQVPLREIFSGLRDPSRAPSVVALSADGRQVYLAATDAGGDERDGRAGRPAAVLVRWEYGQAPAVLSGPPAGGDGRADFRAVAVAPDGGRVLAVGPSREASWWNLALSPAEWRGFEHRLGTAAGLALSPDGRHVLFCGRDPDLCLHTLGLLGDAKTLPFSGHAKGATCAAFSADGRFAVSGGRGGEVCVWDLTGPPPAGGVLRPAKVLHWHAGEVRAVAFAPAGHQFLTGGEDGVVCLGDAARRERLWREPADDASAPVFAVAFGGDGASALYATARSLGRIPLQPAPAAEGRGGTGAGTTAKPPGGR